MTVTPILIKIVFVICFVANFNYGVGFELEQINGRILQFPHAPVWDSSKQSWYYTDLIAPKNGSQIFRLDHRTKKEYAARVQGYTGGVAFILPIKGQRNRFAGGIDLKVVCIEWDGVSVVATLCGDITHLQPDPNNNIAMHYGATDPRGRFYIKPFNKKLCSDVARCGIYKVLRNGVSKPEIEHLKSPSGFTWNKYTNKFYYADLCEPIIKECQWNPVTGDLSSCCVVFRLKSTIPNAAIHSLAVDRQGNLYFFVFNHGLLYKVSPITGSVIWTLQLDVPTVVHLAFGGPLLNELIITTAAVVLDPADGSVVPTALPPNAGSSFILRNFQGYGFSADSYNRNV